jgi:hypothetical protein
MYRDQHRYFIELQPEEGEPAPRWRETELRRLLAARFVERAREWLKEHELHDKVSMMAITALGQVHITCEANVITKLRHQDIMHIAAIRQGAMFVAQMERWNHARK